METLLMRRFNQNAPRIVYYASEITSVTYTLKQTIIIVPTIILHFFFSVLCFRNAIFISTYVVENSALTNDNEQT